MFCFRVLLIILLHGLMSCTWMLLQTVWIERYRKRINVLSKQELHLESDGDWQQASAPTAERNSGDNALCYLL